MSGDKPSCEGNHCPECGADPPDRPYCNVPCPDPIGHLWNRYRVLDGRIADLELKVGELEEHSLRSFSRQVGELFK